MNSMRDHRHWSKIKTLQNTSFVQNISILPQHHKRKSTSKSQSKTSNGFLSFQTLFSLMIQDEDIKNNAQEYSNLIKHRLAKIQEHLI